MSASKSLLTVQLLSGLSIWIDTFLIFSVPVYTWNADAKSIALVAIFLGSPILILGPIAGVITDRGDVRKILIIGIFSRLATTIALAFAPSLNIFFALVLLKSISNIIYFPAYTVTINKIISPNERTGYFSSASMLDQISKILTPLLAGALTIIFPPLTIFLVSAILLACAIVPLFFLIKKINTKHNDNSYNLLTVYRDIASGLSLFRSLPLQLRLGFLYSLMASLALAIYDPHLAGYLASEGHSPVVYSWIVSATAAGAVCAAILIKSRANHAEPLFLRSAGLAVFAIALLATALTAVSSLDRRHLLYPPLWFINGFGYEMLIISSSITMQNHCPPESIGRVSTSFRSSQMLCVIFGPTLGSLLIYLSNHSSTFLIAAALAITTAMISIYSYIKFLHHTSVSTINGSAFHSNNERKRPNEPGS